MRHSTIGGRRIATTSTGEVDRGAELAARRRVDYWCNADHQTTPTFAHDAEIPAEWECQVCGDPATPVRGTAPAASGTGVFFRTPYEFLMMRRTPEEGEQILAEALERLEASRSRR